MVFPLGLMRVTPSGRRKSSSLDALRATGLLTVGEGVGQGPFRSTPAGEPQADAGSRPAARLPQSVQQPSAVPQGACSLLPFAHLVTPRTACSQNSCTLGASLVGASSSSTCRARRGVGASRRGLLLALAPALPLLLRRLLMLALHCRQPSAAEAPRRPHVPTHGSPGRHQEQESRPPPAAQAAQNFFAPTPRHGFPATRRGAPKRGQRSRRGARQLPEHAAAPGSASRGHRASPVALGSLLKAERDHSLRADCSPRLPSLAASRLLAQCAKGIDILSE